MPLSPEEEDVLRRYQQQLSRSVDIDIQQQIDSIANSGVGSTQHRCAAHKAALAGEALANKALLVPSAVSRARERHRVMGPITAAEGRRLKAIAMGTTKEVSIVVDPNVTAHGKSLSGPKPSLNGSSSSLPTAASSITSPAPGTQRQRRGGGGGRFGVKEAVSVAFPINIRRGPEAMDVAEERDIDSGDGAHHDDDDGVGHAVGGRAMPVMGGVSQSDRHGAPPPRLFDGSPIRRTLFDTHHASDAYYGGMLARAEQLMKGAVAAPIAPLDLPAPVVPDTCRVAGTAARRSKTAATAGEASGDGNPMKKGPLGGGDKSPTGNKRLAKHQPAAVPPSAALYAAPAGLVHKSLSIFLPSQVGFQHGLLARQTEAMVAEEERRRVLRERAMGMAGGHPASGGGSGADRFAAFGGVNCSVEGSELVSPRGQQSPPQAHLSPKPLGSLLPPIIMTNNDNATAAHSPGKAASPSRHQTLQLGRGHTLLSVGGVGSSSPAGGGGSSKKKAANAADPNSTGASDATAASPSSRRLVVAAEVYDKLAAMPPPTHYGGMLDVVATALESNLYLSYEAKARDDAARLMLRRQGAVEQSYKRDLLAFSQRVRPEVTSMPVATVASLFVGFRMCLAELKLAREREERREARRILRRKRRSSSRSKGNGSVAGDITLQDGITLHRTDDGGSDDSDADASDGGEDAMAVSARSTSAFSQSVDDDSSSLSASCSPRRMDPVEVCSRFVPSDWLMRREGYLQLCASEGIAPSTALWVKPSQHKVPYSFYGVLAAVCPKAGSGSNGIAQSVADLMTGAADPNTLRIQLTNTPLVMAAPPLLSPHLSASLLPPLNASVLSHSGGGVGASQHRLGGSGTLVPALKSAGNGGRHHLSLSGSYGAMLPMSTSASPLVSPHSSVHPPHHHPSMNTLHHHHQNQLGGLPPKKSVDFNLKPLPIGPPPLPPPPSVVSGDDDVFTPHALMSVPNAQQVTSGPSSVATAAPLSGATAAPSSVASGGSPPSPSAAVIDDGIATAAAGLGLGVLTQGSLSTRVGAPLIPPPFDVLSLFEQHSDDKASFLLKYGPTPPQSPLSRSRSSSSFHGGGASFGSSPLSQRRSVAAPRSEGEGATSSTQTPAKKKARGDADVAGADVPFVPARRSLAKPISPQHGGGADDGAAAVRGSPSSAANNNGRASSPALLRRSVTLSTAAANDGGGVAALSRSFALSGSVSGNHPTASSPAAAAVMGGKAAAAAGLLGGAGATLLAMSPDYDEAMVEELFAHHARLMHPCALPKALEQFFTVLYPRLASFRPQSDKLPGLIKTYDADKDGVLSASEFMTMVLKERFFRYKMK